MDLDIRQLRIFVEVATSGSFSKAAQNLNLSQSAVSQSIGKLESILDLVLIDRISRPLQLTRAGRLLLDRSNAILNSMETLSYDLKLIEGQKPNLRIACCHYFSLVVFNRLVESLLKEVDQLRGYTGHTPFVCQMLENRAVDMVIASSPMNTIESVQSVPLYEENYLIVAPRHVDVSIRTHLDLKAALGDLPLIRFNDDALDHMEIERILRYCELDTEKRIQLNMEAATMQMIASGKGWSIMPCTGIWSQKGLLDQVRLHKLPDFKFSRKMYLNYQDLALKPIADVVERLVKDTLDNYLIEEMQQANPIFVRGLTVLR